VNPTLRRIAAGAKAWWWLAAASAVALGGGAWLAATGHAPLAHALWTAATVAALVPLALQVVRDLVRREPGVDVIAVLAMAGALALGEPFAGAVLALMLATGRLLERSAAGRAERALGALHARAPKRALRESADGRHDDIAVEEVRPGDALLVREGDVVPVDGVLEGARAVLDESTISGEALPVERADGQSVSSGTLNAGPPFRMRASAGAEASTYAAIVALVERARKAKAPMARSADRMALAFVPLTLLLAGGAWAWSGDPARALAVLVVATPCPLLLAVPVAFLGGMSRLARRGVIVKGGAAIEAVARATTVFLDKTGTITTGAPHVTRIVAAPEVTDANTVLRFAAGADRASSHVFASALAHAAHARGIDLPSPSRSLEQRGSGVEAEVEGHLVRVGQLAWVAPAESGSPLALRITREAGSAVFVAIDGRLAGAVLLDDPIRVETPATLRALRRAGIREIALLSGDRSSVVGAVAGALGIDRVLAEHDPAAKEAAVRSASEIAPTIMVGDGINDAAALASAGAGIAIGARGATVASEAADVVIVADRFDRLVDAIEISRRTRACALVAAGVGMALSGVAMLAATGGWIAPAAGAIVQEGIDALALALALRSAVPGRTERRRARTRGLLAASEVEALRAEHGRLVPFIERLREVADALDDYSPAERRRVFAEVRRLLADEVVRHERADDSELYPALARRLPGEDPLSALSRTHQEIFHLAERLDRRIEIDAAEGRNEQAETRRLLYALHAVLELHLGQEAELFFQVGDLPMKSDAHVPADGALGVARPRW
jgi:heavy metal translocating P-type ATPase